MSELQTLEWCKEWDETQDQSAYDSAHFKNGHAFVRGTTYDNGDFDAVCLDCHCHVTDNVNLPVNKVIAIW